MNRVLVTGGAGPLGAFVARRLLRDPDFEVRVSDQRELPGWMREGCEVHRGDLREPAEAREAVRGCSHVIHLAAAFAGDGDRPHTRLELGDAVDAAMVRAALGAEVTRLVYVSSEAVYERAGGAVLREELVAEIAAPAGAEGFSRLVGERYCLAAHEEHGLPYTICRPIGVYGRGVPGLVADLRAADEPLRLPGPAGAPWTSTHATDAADGIVTAMASPAGLGEAFNIASGEELRLGDVARLCWEAAGHSGEPELEEGDGEGRAAPAEKAERVLGWRAGVTAREGIARSGA